MDIMKVVVFGASGKVGSIVVQKLLHNGHEVRAFVRSDSNFSKHEKLTIIKGDVHNTQQVRNAVEGCDIVISALGSWGTKSKDILSTAMQNIVPAMHTSKVQRIISLTGSGAQAPGDDPSAMDRLNRAFIRLAAAKILKDGESHISTLSASNLNWTVIRSPAMYNSTKDDYVLSDRPPAPWAGISRLAVANAMVGLINNADWVKAAPYIRSS